LQVVGAGGEKVGSRVVYLEEEGVYYDLDTEDFYMR
jgi:hypothetical protein